MHFSHLWGLYLLVLVPGLIFFLWQIKKRKIKLLNLFATGTVLNRLISPDLNRYRKLRYWLTVFGLLFIVLSLAGPQFGNRLVEIKRRGVDVIIAVDCSLSMLAEDITPNRLVRAKRELTTFIDRLKGDRIGIIAFAGNAFLQCPLTLDYGAAKIFLDLLDTNLIPQQGTAIGDAVRLAIKSFSQKERKYKVLVLLTDGEDHKSNPESAADDAKKEGVVIYSIGFGNTEGEVIPVRDPQGNVVEYKKNRRGETVMSRLDEMLLQKIALQTGGKYYRSQQGEIEVERIYDDISQMEKKELQSRLLSQYEDRYQYFLFIGLVLLIIEFVIPEI